MEYLLDFEKPLQELELQIQQLQHQEGLGEELQSLKIKLNQLTQQIFRNLNSWERVQLARHTMRPHALDYIHQLVPDFYELHGDLRFGDDAAIVGGLGTWQGQRAMVIGIEKGRRTVDKIKHQFGMPHPEGYRKAQRLMLLADRFRLPVITLIDTPGAFPGMGAEERGQAQAIAESLEVMASLSVPTLGIVIGEGGSGGALALGLCDWVAMMEFSIYSVISPESCASILWSDAKRASEAAEALKLTAQKALELQLIDALIEEPAGGAHRYSVEAIDLVKVATSHALEKLLSISSEQRREQRYQKFRAMGLHTLRTRFAAP